jgi:hypothetical protein
MEYMVIDTDGHTYGYFRSWDYAEGFVKGMFEVDEYLKKYGRIKDFIIVQRYEKEGITHESERSILE